MVLEQISLSIFIDFIAHMKDELLCNNRFLNRGKVVNLLSKSLIDHHFHRRKQELE